MEWLPVWVRESWARESWARRRSRRYQFVCIRCSVISCNLQRPTCCQRQSKQFRMISYREIHWEVPLLRGVLYSEVVVRGRTIVSLIERSALLRGCLSDVSYMTPSPYQIHGTVYTLIDFCLRSGAVVSAAIASVMKGRPQFPVCHLTIVLTLLQFQGLVLDQWFNCIGLHVCNTGVGRLATLLSYHKAK